MTDPGRLIALEGMDEGMLDTVADALSAWLRERGRRVEQTRTPTAGPAGTQIRLHRQGRLRFDPATLALLFTADHLDHLRPPGDILAWLDAGHDVLCVRYLLFSCACLVDRVDLDWLLQINAPCRAPDLTLFVDTSPAPLAGGATGDQVGAPSRAGYGRCIDALRRAGHTIRRVEAEAPVDEVARACQREVARWLKG